MKYEQMLAHKQLRFGDFTLSGAIKNYAPDLKLEPIHTELHLDVNVLGKSAKGYALITLKANVSGAHTLKLDAVDFDDLTVTSPDEKALSYSYDDKVIELDFERDFQKGDEVVVRVEYSIEAPIAGLQFSQPDLDRPDFPVYAITDNETERARYWFPCVDFPTIRPKMEYFLTADEEYTILANGALISEEAVDGEKDRSLEARLSLC